MCYFGCAYTVLHPDLNNTKYFYVKLSDWRLHFFYDYPVDLIGACKRITVSAKRDVTISNAETNSYFPSSNPATVALYVSWSVNIKVSMLVQGAIDWGRIFTLCIVKSEVPSLTASGTLPYASVTHVNHTKV